MTHTIITDAEGNEYDCVTNEHGRLVALAPQDDAGIAWLAWHPQQQQPILRDEWRVDEFKALRGVSL